VSAVTCESTSRRELDARRREVSRLASPQSCADCWSGPRSCADLAFAMNANMARGRARASASARPSRRRAFRCVCGITRSALSFLRALTVFSKALRYAKEPRPHASHVHDVTTSTSRNPKAACIAGKGKGHEVAHGPRTRDGTGLSCTTSTTFLDLSLPRLSAVRSLAALYLRHSGARRSHIASFWRARGARVHRSPTATAGRAASRLPPMPTRRGDLQPLPWAPPPPFPWGHTPLFPWGHPPLFPWGHTPCFRGGTHPVSVGGRARARPRRCADALRAPPPCPSTDHTS
jgi:hypothetical protein